MPQVYAHSNMYCIHCSGIIIDLVVLCIYRTHSTVADPGLTMSRHCVYPGSVKVDQWIIVLF